MLFVLLTFLPKETKSQTVSYFRKWQTSTVAPAEPGGAFITKGQARLDWIEFSKGNAIPIREETLRLKNSSLTLIAYLAAVVAAAVFSASAVAQAPQTAPAQPPPAAAPHEDHGTAHPAPTNLKVLPKTLTGDQVHEIMEGWEAALGTHCSTCHTADPTKIGPNGRPALNFPDDSRPEKSTARLMYKMVEDINGNYISMVDNSGAPVTCWTCHRGHLGPEPFVAPTGAPVGGHEGAPPPAKASSPSGTEVPQPR
jgi:hypothetical protein